MTADVAKDVTYAPYETHALVCGVCLPRAPSSVVPLWSDVLLYRSAAGLCTRLPGGVLRAPALPPAISYLGTCDKAVTLQRLGDEMTEPSWLSSASGKFLATVSGSLLTDLVSVPPMSNERLDLLTELLEGKDLDIPTRVRKALSYIAYGSSGARTDHMFPYGIDPPFPVSRVVCSLLVDSRPDDRAGVRMRSIGLFPPLSQALSPLPNEDLFAAPYRVG